jgi:hypothetical protein
LKGRLLRITSVVRNGRQLSRTKGAIMNQFKRTNATLYIEDGAKINPDASAADLFEEVFYDPKSPLDIYSQVMGTVDDDLQLLFFAMEGADAADVSTWQRAIQRIQSRIKIAQALKERFEAAERETELGGVEHTSAEATRPENEKPEPQMPVITIAQLRDALNRYCDLQKSATTVGVQS